MLPLPLPLADEGIVFVDTFVLSFLVTCAAVSPFFKRHLDRGWTWNAVRLVLLECAISAIAALPVAFGITVLALWLTLARGTAGAVPKAIPPSIWSDLAGVVLLAWPSVAVATQFLFLLREQWRESLCPVEGLACGIAKDAGTSSGRTQ